MLTVCEKNKCNGCMACIDICPQKCISINDNIYSYNAVKDDKACVDCHLCEKVCPNNVPVKKRESIEWKQGWASSIIRKDSSSGGVATSIIKSFIEKGGYVASCLFKNGQFIFEITNSFEIARNFAGSKYVKSNPVGIYKKIQEKLKTNKVLFIGLPCQVAGLKNYINNQINLYTIDLICHGTPSPKILEQFFIENGYKLSEQKEIQFRKKTNFGIYSNNIKSIERGMDSYLISFLNSADFTDNCYSCIYATKNRVSDVTLGDSWGSELDIEKKDGISLVLIQTSKGKDLVESSCLELREVDYEKALKSNAQLNNPSSCINKRDELLKMILNGKTIKHATFKLFPVKVLKQRLKYILKRIKVIK